MTEIIRSLAKDLKVEFRNPAAAGAAAAFACITTLAVSMVSRGTSYSPDVLSVFLWIILFFCAMNSLLHTFIREEQERTALFLTLNIKPENIYLSKLIFNCLFFLVLQLIVCPLFVFFMDVNIINIPLFVLTVLAGGLALSSASTVLAAIAAGAGGRGALFTIISFPLLLPCMLVSIFTTAVSLEQAEGSFNNVFFLLAFSGTVIALSFLLFRYIWLEK